MCVLTLHGASLFTSENKDAAFVSCRPEEQKMFLYIDCGMEACRRFIHAAEPHMKHASGCRETCCCCSERHKAELHPLSLPVCEPRSPSVTALMLELMFDEAQAEDQHIRVRVCTFQSHNINTTSWFFSVDKVRRRSAQTSEGNTFSVEGKRVNIRNPLQRNCPFRIN